VKTKGVEREAKKLIDKYGYTGALTRAAGEADNATTDAQETYWAAVEEAVLSMQESCNE